MIRHSENVHLANKLGVCVALLFLLVAPQVRADTVKLGGTGAGMRPMEILSEAFHKSQSQVKVTIIPGLGSRGGRRALLEGAIDVAVSAEPSTEAEIKKGAVPIEFAKTPFIFVTAKNNPETGLSLKQVVDIYDGRMVTWTNGKRLRLILRPDGDSDNRVLRGISPEMAKAVNRAQGRPGMKVGVTDQDSAEAVATIPGAFGTSTLALVTTEQRPLKPLSINGVAPSPETLADGSYPYHKSMYFVTNPKPAESVRQFIAFVQSKQGSEILSSLGFWVPESKTGK